MDATLAPRARIVVGGYRVWPLLKKTGKEIIEDNVLGLAAQTAYYFFFSLFPLVLFAAPLLSIIGDRREISTWVVSQIVATVPPQAAEMVLSTLNDVLFSKNAPGLISAGALLAAFAGSNIFMSLVEALNRAYDVTETRPWWKRQLIAMACVGVAGVVITVATVIMLGGESLVAFVARATGADSRAAATWGIVQIPIAFTMLTGLAWIIYWFLPNIRQHRGLVLVGSVAATVAWLLVTMIFRLYVQNFASYNKTYGTIGAVIVLLTWMYLSMLVVLSGGELISELHHGTGRLVPRRGSTLHGQLLTGAGHPSSTETVERAMPLSSPRT